MSAPTNAPVLAMVVPITPFGWAMIRADGTRDGYEAVSRDVAESYRSTYDAEHPEHAPHTVQQLARVVRVVAVDDAADTIRRADEAIERVLLTGEFDVRELAARSDALRALAAALTPPEPTGTEGA